MSTFFIKPKLKSGSKRKINTAKRKNEISSKQNDDEEIDSDDIGSSGAESTEDISENEEETAQDKRLRLAKKYLEEIEKEEKRRVEDKELHDHVSHRLKEGYLDSIGKLRKKIAALYKGYKKDTIITKRQKEPVTTIILSENSDIMFTGSKSAIVTKWKLPELKVLGVINCDSAKEKNLNGVKKRCHILALSLSSDMKFLAIADGSNTIQIWCPQELRHLKNFNGHRDIVSCLVFRKDTHQLYSGSRDRSVKIWSLDDMAYVESLFGHQAEITGIDALSRERAITCGGIDCSVRIWKITEESQLIYNGHSGSIENVKLINDESFLSCGDDGSLCVWSTLKKKPICVKPLTHGKQDNSEANWISAIATLLNTDLIASGSCDGFIRIWSLNENGKNLTQLFEIPINGFVNSLAFTNDGRHLLAGIGQEHRLGRWWRIKEARNSIVLIELAKQDSDS